MGNLPLDIYDEFPKDMKAYLRNYGWNFSKKACEYAVSMMKRMNPSTNSMEKVEPMKKEEVDDMLQRNGVAIENAKGYNHVYVANMAKADFYKSSIDDEMHLAKYVKDVIDDPDNRGGNVFRKWYCDMVANEEPVMWDELL